MKIYVCHHHINKLFSKVRNTLLISCVKKFHSGTEFYLEVVDPRDLARELDMMNCIVKTDENRLNSKAIAQNIRACKVFVACLSDEYVNDKACVDEFVYAKKHGANVVIPIGSFLL